MSKDQIGFRDADSLTQWVKYLLYAQVVVAFVSIISGYLEYQLLSDYLHGTYVSREQAVADGEANDSRQLLVWAIYLIVFFVSGFLILRWIHRANYNARQLGADDLTFTPGWAIGYYFIPIVSLFKPYKAMKEIWEASEDAADEDASGSNWLLPTWWTLWIVSSLLGQISLRMTTRASEIDQLMNLNLLNQVANLVDIPLALVFLSIVTRVHDMQSKGRRLNEQWRDSGDAHFGGGPESVGT